jgi:hypothetical protein
MNLKKLKQAEKDFIKKYPGGFKHPRMQEIGKAHKMDKMIEMTKEAFQKKYFKDPDLILDSMVKIISRSSMVSIFEKPKFKDYVKSLDPHKKKLLVKHLKAILYGNQAKGFDSLMVELKEAKMAKWTLMTVLLVYLFPEEEFFIKPTTTKNVIKYFEIDLVYRPTPSYEFYEAYREVLNLMKSKVKKSLSPNNAAFTGFLMMALEDAKIS